MKLSQQEIEKLFDFTQKKNVESYDVQVELVDHLASSIESKMEENSTLSFDKALNEVYQGFGYYGFTKLIEEKEKSAEKKVKLLYRKQLKKLITFPRFLYFIGTFFIALFLANRMSYNWFLGVELAAIVIIYLTLPFQIAYFNYLTKKTFTLAKYSNFSALIGINIVLIQALFREQLFESSRELVVLVFTVMVHSIYLISETVIEVRKTYQKEYPEAFV